MVDKEKLSDVSLYNKPRLSMQSSQSRDKKYFQQYKPTVCDYKISIVTPYDA